MARSGTVWRSRSPQPEEAPCATLAQGGAISRASAPPSRRSQGRASGPMGEGQGKERDVQGALREKGWGKGPAKSEGMETKGLEQEKGDQGVCWRCGKIGHKAWECQQKALLCVEEAAEVSDEEESCGAGEGEGRCEERVAGAGAAASLSRSP